MRLQRVRHDWAQAEASKTFYHFSWTGYQVPETKVFMLEQGKEPWALQGEGPYQSCPGEWEWPRLMGHRGVNLSHLEKGWHLWIAVSMTLLKGSDFFFFFPWEPLTLPFEITKCLLRKCLYQFYLLHWLFGLWLTCQSASLSIFFLSWLCSLSLTLFSFCLPHCLRFTLYVFSCLWICFL